MKYVGDVTREWSILNRIFCAYQTALHLPPWILILKKHKYTSVTSNSSYIHVLIHLCKLMIHYLSFCPLPSSLELFHTAKFKISNSYLILKFLNHIRNNVNKYKIKCFLKTIRHHWTPSFFLNILNFAIQFDNLLVFLQKCKTINFLNLRYLHIKV